MANDPAPTTDPPPPKKPAPATEARRWRWLINNQERVLGFAMPPVYSKEAKASTPDANVLSIPPGASIVEAKRWEALKAKDPPDAKIEGDTPIGAGEIHRLLTTKIPKAAHRSRQPEAAGSYHLVEGPHIADRNAPLDGLSESEAKAIVEEIRDRELVRGLIKIEKRPTINQALHEVFEELTKGAPSKVAV